MNAQLNGPALALRIAIGLMATLAGLDKFFNLLVNWPQYIAPIALHMSPISPSALMGVIGIVEFVVGVTILAIRPNVGAYVASAWLVLVAINLVLGGHYDIAVRDIVLSISAFMLARLEEARAFEQAPVVGATHRTVTA